MQVALIVAAGGKGTRFKKRGKLFYPLKEEPLLIHTLKSFLGFSQIKQVIVVVPPAMKKNIAGWAARYGVRNIHWVAGGKSRAESVLNGLKKVKRHCDWVMVHDGGRPLVSQSVIKHFLAAARKLKTEGLILASKVVPTIKRVCAGTSIIDETVDREFLYEAETPQLVRRKILEQAYRQNPNALAATDESSLLESIGAKVQVITHGSWNPKITSFEDLKLAQAYLEGNQKMEWRTGFGRDIHRLVAGRKFVLGGRVIPALFGPLGHSDGDALLHAITDAILGIIGEGDIGDHFSDRNKSHKNIASKKMLEHALKKARAQGWQLSHLDSVIVLEKPRLTAHKLKIKKNIAKLLQLDPNAVSIKAKTMEGLGSEGKGLAISCEAIVTMRRKSSW